MINGVLAQLFSFLALAFFDISGDMYAYLCMATGSLLFISGRVWRGVACLV